MERSAAEAASHPPAEGRMRGSSQAGLRAHNERAVLTLIRRHGALAKADIARRTGLSPQTASVIMRALEKEALVLRAEPRRGRIGQPSVPMRLNPDGAFSLGLKIGRRSVDLVLMDFVGAIRARRRRTYAFPEVSVVLDFAAASHAELVAELGDAQLSRLAGIGVAMPSEFWSWAEEIGAPPGRMEAWQTVDIEAELAALTGLAVHVANDATAACAAENVFGKKPCGDFVYLYVGAFVGGGVVIDGALVSGRTGNAGALGSMPVPSAVEGRGAHWSGAAAPRHDQLINVASIHVLETMMEAEGRDPLSLWQGADAWGSLGDLLDRWVRKAAWGLAYAAVTASSIYDFECAVIDGSFPEAVRVRLVEATRQAAGEIRHQGLSPIQIRAGTIGENAREIGSASLPFFARFLIDHRVFYAEAA